MHLELYIHDMSDDANPLELDDVRLHHFKGSVQIAAKAAIDNGFAVLFKDRFLEMTAASHVACEMQRFADTMPFWAKYLCEDGDGRWFFYADKPVYHSRLLSWHNDDTKSKFVDIAPFQKENASSMIFEVNISKKGG